MEAGTKTMDETTLQRKIGSQTGGISTSIYSDIKSSAGVVSSAGPDQALLYFMIRGKAVTDKIPVMLDLFSEVLLNAKLDNQKRAVEMLKESKVRKETSVITSGHTYAASRLAARYSFLGYLGEVTGGLTSVREAGALLEQAEKDWPAVVARLEKLRASIVKKGAVIVNLTGEDKVLNAAKPAVEQFLKNIPSNSKASDAATGLVKSWTSKKLLSMQNEGFSVPSQVNYVVKGGPIFQPGEAVSGSSSVVSRFLSLHYLWDNVRVMGGAYGGFARFSETTGRFVYMSYRDPNLKKTLDIYDEAPAALLETEISDEDILQGVIGAIGDLDSPLSPDQKGYASLVQYLQGESAADRQKWRDQVLSSSSADFKDFANRLKAIKDKGSVVVFGSQSALDAANEALPEADKLKIEQAFSSK